MAGPRPSKILKMALRTYVRTYRIQDDVVFGLREKHMMYKIKKHIWFPLTYVRTILFQFRQLLPQVVHSCFGLLHKGRTHVRTYNMLWSIEPEQEEPSQQQIKQLRF